MDEAGIATSWKTICVSVITIRKYDKLRVVWIEFDLIFLIPVEDLIYILFRVIEVQFLESTTCIGKYFFN